MTKDARIYNGEKTVSLVHGSGKIGQLHVKKKITIFPHTMYKNKLKINT